MFSPAQRVAVEMRKNRSIVAPPRSFEMITFRLICLEYRGQVDERVEVKIIRPGRYILFSSVSSRATTVKFGLSLFNLCADLRSTRALFVTSRSGE